MDSSIKYFLRKTEYFSSGLLYFWLLFFPFILTVTGNDSVGVLINVDYTQLCRNQQLIFCRKFEFSVSGTLTHCSEHLNTFSRRATKEDWFEGSWSWRKRSHWVRSWFYPVKCHWLCTHTTFSYCNDQKYRKNCLVYFFHTSCHYIFHAVLFVQLSAIFWSGRRIWNCGPRYWYLCIVVEDKCDVIFTNNSHWIYWFPKRWDVNDR